ncbi:hypothetical protein SapgrDRAFT_3534 [Saprospira grandis DSM 2844]|uniref:RHS repeat-associated core domain protein n=1 Tax=Saprospira grandis DSM 2844 TaxID=694433 RepID=J0P5M8_9BACT|nr:hypothetical protein [Saprospira grandis]EJF55169.1 hypothetical protein SapgrDRAFT_3534 [Saprospira grandis DSM 2844]
MRKSPEIGSGHHTTYFRELDGRMGRWWSADPITFPHQSPYNTFDGNPIYYTDASGASVGYPEKEKGESYKAAVSTEISSTSFARSYVAEVAAGLSIVPSAKYPETIVWGNSMTQDQIKELGGIIDDLYSESFIFAEAYLTLWYTDLYYSFNYSIHKDKKATSAGGFERTHENTKNDPGAINLYWDVFDNFAKRMKTTRESAIKHIVHEEVIHAAQLHFYRCNHHSNHAVSVLLLEAEVRVAHAIVGLGNGDWEIREFARGAAHWIDAVKNKRKITPELQNEFDKAWGLLLSRLDVEPSYSTIMDRDLRKIKKNYGVGKKYRQYQKYNNLGEVKKMKPLYLIQVIDLFYKK